MATTMMPMKIGSNICVTQCVTNGGGGGGGGGNFRVDNNGGTSS